jgi:hypothetical protein
VPDGAGDSVGEGGSIRAASARASSARAAAVRCSSSRSAVAARTRARAASYFFASAAVATMASSFCQNLADTAAWQVSAAAIGGGVAAHREVVRDVGDATEGERVADPLGLREAEAKKNLGSDYHVGGRSAAEYWIDLY